MNWKLMAGLAVTGTGVVLIGRWATLSTAAGAASSSAAAALAAGELPRIVVASCKSEANGTLCGPPETSKYCLHDTCVTNTCGDRRVLADEQCDDGNLGQGDGCVGCRWELRPNCGNGLLDIGEECDDGNLLSGDACSARCTAARCGDGMKNEGEQCDDGNHDDTDTCTLACQTPPPGQGRVTSPGEQGWLRGADGTWLLTTVPEPSTRAGSKLASRGPQQGSSGSGVSASAASGSKSGASGQGGASGRASALSAQTATTKGPGGNPGGGNVDTCKQCRDQHCRSYGGGFDVIAGCFDAVNPEVGASPEDSTYLLECQEIVSCARAHGCAYDPTREAAGCYCGSNSVDECIEKGPAKDAPCRDEWERGTRSRVNSEVLRRFSLPEFPAGMAFQVLQCDLRHCKEYCSGPSQDP